MAGGRFASRFAARFIPETVDGIVGSNSAPVCSSGRVQLEHLNVVL